MKRRTEVQPALLLEEQAKRMAPVAMTTRFRLHRRYWGRGYATEAAQAAPALGFARFGLAVIVGRARIDNAASHAVLRKLGMRPAFEYRAEGHTWVQYELSAEAYRRLRCH